jgi:hypothetical protein
MTVLAWELRLGERWNEKEPALSAEQQAARERILPLAKP